MKMKEIENCCERNFKEDFPKNCLGEWSSSSSRRRTHDCSVKLSSNFPWRVVQYIYRNSVVYFQEQKAFVLKTIFLLVFGLSRIMYLLECDCLTCALRWGVTHVENYHYWALLTLLRDHYFRYRECTGGRRSLEAAF